MTTSHWATALCAIERERMSIAQPLSEQLAQLLSAANDSDLAVVSIPIPRANLEPTLARGGGLLWRPPRGPAIAGGGTAAAIRAAGTDRFDSIARQARELFARIDHIRHPAAPAVAPRLFGGFSFCPGSADRPPWSGLGDALFWLPRWWLGRAGDGRCWLSIAVNRPADARSRAAAFDCAATVLRAGDSAVPSHRAQIGAVVAEIDRDQWTRGVEAIRADIAGGRSEKIVAARRSEVALATEVDPRRVVALLGERFEDCFVFAMWPAAAAFVGATPERLVSRTGNTVVTEALAGSISPQAGAGALLSSSKDRGEQGLVVREIERALAPLCARLDVPNEPGIRALRDVLHLETKIAGTLHRPTHVLDLVRALHPTPAVGGVPTDRALRWIESTEPEPRGWYAAPVGWFDATGDGEFAVAIRSGLLARRRAYVWAGAGIVRDSDPVMEYDETGLKQRAVLDALGIAPETAAPATEAR